MVRNKLFLRRLTSLLCCGTFVASAMAQVTLNVDAGDRTTTIGSRHYGIFFEEINHAGDGGLYAELIHNRSFEDNSSNPDKWWTVGNGNMELITEDLLNDAQGYALQVTMTAAGDGVRNEGFWGINVVNGQTYKLTFWVKGVSSYSGTLTADLQSEDGTSLGSTEIPVTLTSEWTKMTAEITATGDDTEGWFALTGSEAGVIALDVVSLFPPTYKDRENGCRIDLAEMLEAMKPAFMRFPGGCYVEGYYSNGSENRFEWKKTIGAIEERPGHLNNNWGYQVSDGFGFHEMLQLAEDLGAEPLFVVNIGLGHGWYEEYTEIDEYVQEALDALEYCNGDAETTEWGALRAANGHPEPFNLYLIEVGNENYNYTSDSNSDQSDHYAERYEQFRKAIKAAYPDVTIIGNVESWSTDTPSWRNVYPVDAVDEHYYRNPSWFVSMYNKYDTYSRSSHGIYVGEYAVTSDFGTNGNLNAALGEAVFMQGMENNADVCVMNSYAPIFVNENNYNWKPDMIRFNSYTSYGTPSYYIQQLFPNNVGKQNVSWTEENNNSSETNYVGLSTWQTSVTFDNVKVTDTDGNEIFSDDFSTEKSEWLSQGGTWSVSNGALTQSNTSMTGSIYLCQTEVGDSYTFEVEATKNRGAEGFLIAFNYEDSDNYCWWNLGGWSNTTHAVEMCVDGTKSTLTSVSGSLTTGQTYSVKVVVNGTDVKCYLDDELIHNITLPVTRKVYVSSNIDDDENVLYLKMVNPSSTEQTVTVNLSNASANGGSVTVLSSDSGTDENSLDAPNNVSPKESELNVSGTQFTYDVAAYSANFLRINVTDVNIVEEEAAELPEALVQYTFEVNEDADDAGQYTGQLMGGAAVVEMNDGNHALYTGSSTDEGYFDLGADMATQTLAKLTGDYTISLALALPNVGALESYCWAYGFANGTSQYIGFVNSPDNTEWYFTIMDGTSVDVSAESGLSYGTWHNIVYVQSDNKGLLYVDGRLTDEQTVTQSPADMAANISEACLAHSPFSSDAVLSQAFLDNFRIYDSALTEAQVATLYAEVENLEAKADEVTYQNDVEEITSLMKVFNYLHATTTLPTTTDGGSAVEWTLTTNEGMDGYVTLSGSTLTVNNRPEGTDAVAVGTITATVDGTLAMQKTLVIAPDDDRYGYLYCYMNSSEEITNYALGTKEDKGKVFNELIGGAEIFDTDEIAQIEQGTRDAFIARGQDGDGYFITTTDMCNATSGVWRNKGMNLLHSDDLIHWTGVTFNFTDGKSIFSDPSASTGVYDTDDEYANINRVWAPQFIWDESYNGGEGAYLVYYSLLSSNDGDDYDRIFYSYTDREFKTLTQPRIFFDPGISVIDADIIYNPYDSLYHMYYKREEATGSDRGIYEASSPTLVDGTWTEIMHVTNEGSYQVEGSSTIRRINEDVYNLYYMRYTGDVAYKYCETDHLGLNATGSNALGGTGDFQHGSFMTVTEEEYTMLQAWSDVTLLIPSVESMYEETGSSIFTEAVEQANEALAKTTVSELAVALPAALETLKGAYSDYVADICSGLQDGEEIDLTFLLTNPDFTDGSTGWTGTTFTQATSGVAEYWNTTYDVYQILEDLPAGTYRLEAHGFYRYGLKENAYAAHTGGTEKLLAQLYLNDASATFMSLYDESVSYTYSPYTYPDGVSGANTAFNTDGYYGGNQVTYTMEEAGDLTVGIRKTELESYDWNCFDNFKLYYTAKPSDGIQEVTETVEDGPVDVYTLSGVRVRTSVQPYEAVQGLPRGIYIVGKKKIVVK